MTEMLADILTRSLLAFSVAAILCQFAIYLAGIRLGRKWGHESHSIPEGQKILSGGILALTAFVLALTLSFASNRMQDRRINGIEEANAIGTAWLQAGAVGGTRGTAIAKGLAEYLQVRRDELTLGHDDPGLQAAAKRTGELQTAIWFDVTVLVREDPGDLSVSLMNAVNHAFDMTTAERLAVNNRMPARLVALMIFMIFAGVAVIGFQVGATGHSHPWLALILITVWTCVVVLILDFGYPRVGSHRTPTEAYDLTLQSFAP